MTKSVFITGASEGLGRCFAVHFARQGYRVTAVARNEERLKSLVEELSAINAHQHNYIKADLSADVGHQQCQEALEQTHYDVLINNAGFSYFGEFKDSSLNDELAVMKVNIECLMKLAHTYMKHAKRGDALINLSSLTYYLPTPVQPSYVASKNWIASFSESLWYQGRAQGVYVQGLCPGIAKTQFVDRAGAIKHRNLLDLIAVSPETVVNASYRALEKRKGPIVLPGIADKLMAGIMTLLPRRASVWLMGKVGDMAF
ncbi:3-oxoacyl-[acyl-carrier-protein] reductase FabG [BD1-7 clade bacterium]|nr:3-oxoacyl-[acyl-carrier-protein] reductase FabG [BD1-7 clade bacterium]